MTRPKDKTEERKLTYTEAILIAIVAGIASAFIVVYTTKAIFF